MAKFLKILILSLLFILQTLSIPAQPNIPEEILIDDFSSSKMGKNDSTISSTLDLFPNEWKYRDKKALSTYGIVKENDKFMLKARSLNSGIQILKKFKVDLKNYPVLNWKWRVIKFPSEDKITDRNKGDNGASVYAIFSGFLSRTALKYTWSNYYSKSTFIDKGPRMKVLVLRDKSDPKSTWTEESRNIYDDYLKLFGKEPPKMIGIALMTDSDNTENYAEADYTDFKMKVSKK